MNRYVFLLLRRPAATMLILCFMLAGTAQQNANPDSLLLLLRTLPLNSRAYLQTQVNLANYWVYRNLDSASWHIDQVLENSKTKAVFPRGYARHYLVKAWTYHGRMMLKEAKLWYYKALNEAREGGSEAEIREIELNLGALLTDIHAPEAQAFALGIIERVEPPITQEDKEFWITGHLYLVRIAEYQSELGKALDILQRLQENPILHELPDYRYGVLNSTAIVLDRMGDGQLAIRYYRKALKMHGLYDFERKELLLNMASTWLDVENPDSCLHYAVAAQAVAPLSENEQWAYFFALARAYWLKGEAALAQTNVEKALEIARKTQNDNFLVQSLLKKAEFSAAVNNWPLVKSLLDEALPYWKGVDNLEAQTLDALLKLKSGLATSRPELVPELDKYVALSTRYASLRNDRQLKQVVYQYEVRQQEQENERLRQELAIQRQRRRIQWLGLCLLALAVMAAGGTAAFWRRNTRLTQQYNALLEEEKEQLIFEQEELQLLNAQLQNQLNELSKQSQLNHSMLIEVQGRDQLNLIEANDIIYLIAEHEGVRYYLANGGSIWSDKPLREAIDLLPNIMFIQTYRSIVVNMRHVICINARTIKMKNGSELPIGRVYKYDIRSRFEGF